MKIYRLFTLSLVLFFGVVLTSCLTIEEKLKLNKDGSGTLESIVDMGELLANPMMRMAMEEEMKKEGETMPARIDSTIDLLGELKPLNPQWTAAEIALLERIDSRMIMDFDQGEGGIYITMPFESLDQLMQMQMLMSEAKQPAGDDQENPFGGLVGGGGNTISNYVWKAGKMTRNTQLNLGELSSMAEGEEMEMAKMMLGEAKMIFSMEFPGEIKKVKGYPGHRIEGGNTLVQEFSFLDMFDDQDKIDDGLDGEVKYKK